MTPAPASPLARVVRPGKVTATLARLELRELGAAVRAFAPLIERFGAQAARDVALVERVLAGGALSRSDAAVNGAWNAIIRLNKLGRHVPEGPAKQRIWHELERRAQTLLARQDDYAEIYAESAAKAGADMRKAPIDRAVAALRLSPKTPAAKSGAVLARVRQDLETADATLVALWKQFHRVTPTTSAAVHKAAEVAAERAPAVEKILRQRGVGAAARRAQVMGHFVKVRSELGEGYALANKVWLAELEKELARAEAIAAKLGPGHEVVYLTQLEHALTLNGREGPDALIAILNRKTHLLYDPTKAQVKVAEVSEGIEQTINDIARSAGQEKDRAVASAVYTFERAGKTEAFVLGTHPDVELATYVINAAGSRLPKRDLDLMDALGLGTRELQLDLSVEQFTHLALSVMEGALEAAKAAR